MTVNPPAGHPDPQMPGASAPALCKRPGCGNTLPDRDRRRTRQVCSDQCARRYHNDARISAPAAPPGARHAGAPPPPRRATAPPGRAPPPQVPGPAAPPTRPAPQIAKPRPEGPARPTAARAEAARHARERDDAAGAASRADAETGRARQGEADARAETERARADAARERDTLREQHQAQLGAVTALTAAERARAERAEQQLDAERADRRHLTTALTPPGNGKLPRAAGGKADHHRPHPLSLPPPPSR